MSDDGSEEVCEGILSRYRDGNTVFGYRLTDQGCAAFCNVSYQQVDSAMVCMLEPEACTPEQKRKVFDDLMMLKHADPCRLYKSQMDEAIVKKAAEIMFSTHLHTLLDPLLQHCTTATSPRDMVDELEAFVFEHLQYFETLADQRTWLNLHV